MTSNQVARHTLSRKEPLPSGFDIVYPIEVSVPDSINSALLHVPAWIMSTLFLIVHHPGSFRPAQHKVVCKLLLKVVCGRPSLLSTLVNVGQFGSLDLRTFT